MAEEDLKRAILEKIQREKEAILNKAREEAGKILKDAQDNASNLKKEHLKEFEKNYLSKKTKETSKLELDTKREILEAKEKKISQVFSCLKERFQIIRNDKDSYDRIFKNLLQESLQPIPPGSGLKLKVNPVDEQLARDVVKKFKLDIKLELMESIGAGLVLSDSEEKIIILNTFSSRLNKLMPELRQDASRALFG